MFGNLITNRQLKTLRAESRIFIEPFSERNLKATHYTLNPGRVLRRIDDHEWDIVFAFTDTRKEFRLDANEYVIVEVKQTVKIQSDGIVGRFVTASTNIESGLLVVAGQIDSQYGTGGEALRFGVKNLLSTPNVITCDTRLAHLEFFDLRGITSEPREPTLDEKQVWELRKRDPKWEQADSDGVKY